MINKYLKKGIVLGIILLFLGASTVSGTNFDIKNNSKNEIITQNYNLVGSVTTECYIDHVEVIWDIEEDRNFTYPIINGKVKLNYTFCWNAYSNDKFPYLFPWLVINIMELVYDNSPYDPFIGFRLVHYFKTKDRVVQRCRTMESIEIDVYPGQKLNFTAHIFTYAFQLVTFRSHQENMTIPCYATCI